MKEIMTVRAPNELRKALSDEARQQGQTRNALILQILWGYFRKLDKVENKSPKGRK